LLWIDLLRPVARWHHFVRIDAHHQVGNLRPSITWQTSVIWLCLTEPPVGVAAVSANGLVLTATEAVISMVASTSARLPSVAVPRGICCVSAWLANATSATTIRLSPRFRMAGLHRIFRRVYIRKSRKAKGLAPEILPIDRSIV
jgi:hypothetical protein